MGNCPSRKSSYSSQDIIIKCPVGEITRQLFSDYIVVWHAINADSPQNKQIRSELEKFCEVRIFTDWERASGFLLRTKKKCYVITSGENGELLVQKICSAETVLGIYIYCKNKDYHFAWAQKYPKTASVEKHVVDIVKQIKEKLLKWYQTQDFETRFPVFVRLSEAEMTPLKIAVHFKNHVEAKNDLLCLAKMIYSDNHQMKSLIDDFEASYDGGNPKNILKNWWSDKESFLYRITNSCLRVATLDSLEYCRSVLKHMEQAIKEEKNEGFEEGLVLYKGIEMSEEAEWLKWKESLDGEIEVQGFLSASKRKDAALEFIKKDEGKMVLMTIIMPKGPKEVADKQGFALKEEEVLFNLRSRFTVLEVEDSPSKRQIVLCYGAQGFRRFVAEKNPVLEISVPKGKISCLICQDEVCEEKMFYLSLGNLKNYQYCCQKCLKKFLKRCAKNNPLLCIPAGMKGYKTKLKGFLVRYPPELKIPFYGYKCHQCQAKKLENSSYYYKCIECCQVWCGECAENLSECMEAKHNIILESNPFSFWCEKDIMKGKTLEAFQQAENYFNKGQKDKAMGYYQLYLRQNDQKKGNDKDLATACHNLGIIYNNRKEYSRALGYFLKALEIRKSLLGENHTDVASTYNRIGLVYWSQGEHQKALEFCSKASDIWKSVHGEKNANVATSYNNIGLTHQDQEEYTKALDSYFKAVEIRKAASGENNSNLAIYYDNIARTFQEQEEEMKASEYYLKALDIRKSLYGDNHDDVADSYDNIGWMESKKKEYSKALEHHLKALEIRKSLYGENHADVADSYDNIGGIYHDQKEYSKALENYLKALEIRRFVYGEDHAKIALCCNRIGQVYDSQKEFNPALEYYFQALEIGTLIDGERHVSIGTYYNNIGIVYHNQGNQTKALEYYSKALEIRKLNYGEVHSSVATLYHNLGRVNSGKKALDFHLKALGIREEVYGENSSHVADSCNYVGSVYENERSYKKSIEYYLKALEIRETIYGADSSEVASSCHNVGIAYFYFGKNKEALKYCSRALKIRKSVDGENHPDTVEIQEFINGILMAQKRSSVGWN